VNSTAVSPYSGAGRLAGRGAVVTGASRGIGAAIAEALAAEGAAVALVARNGAALATLASTLGAGAIAVPCDVSSAVAVRSAIADIQKHLSAPPTILVNNAGVFEIAPLADTSETSFEAAVDVNLVAPFRFVRALLPLMRTAGHGHVVTIGSVSDRNAFSGNGAYSAAKFGARGMHEVLRAETRGSTIRATLVSPGPTDTSLWDDVDPDSRADFPNRADMLRADDVARAVLFAVTQPPHVNIDELRISPA
jgi:NADP-dependent 3-hydroxy acid dehydrogenase YdfG